MIGIPFQSSHMTQAVCKGDISRFVVFRDTVKNIKGAMPDFVCTAWFGYVSYVS
jgi:hypothetical protein